MLTILVEGVGFNPIAGSVLGFLGALTVSYWLNAQWTFDQAGMWYLLGQFIAAIVVPLHNFLLNFYWTFKNM